MIFGGLRCAFGMVRDDVIIMDAKGRSGVDDGNDGVRLGGGVTALVDCDEARGEDANGRWVYDVWKADIVAVAVFGRARVSAFSTCERLGNFLTHWVVRIRWGVRVDLRFWVGTVSRYTRAARDWRCRRLRD
jgi:hypothetical protein